MTKYEDLPMDDPVALAKRSTDAGQSSAGQAWALIAIAEELRTVRKYFCPTALIDPEFQDHIDQCDGCVSETEYPYGRQV